MGSESDDASAEHRRKLEKLFGGGNGGSSESDSGARSQDGQSPRGPGSGLRRSPSGRVFSSPRKSTGRQPSEYRLRLERLRIAREPEQIVEATDNFLKNHQLPDDLDVLYKVLQHPNEKVLREAMGQISSLIMQGRVSGTLILEDRLKELKGRVEEPATKSYVDGLFKQVAALKEQDQA